MIDFDCLLLQYRDREGFQSQLAKSPHDGRGFTITSSPSFTAPFRLT
jgi:hypothetical protein